MSKVSFTVRRPTPPSRAESSGVDSDSGSGFKVPGLPRHLADSAPGSPLARSTTSSPKPKGRPITYYSAEPDSSDDEDERVEDELVTGFDQFGVQRVKPKKKAEGPLVIPALQNRDWRELARKRRTANQYVPAAGKAQTGADGSVAGLGTRDTINSGPQLVGLQLSKKASIKQELDGDEIMADVREEVPDVKMEETEDQKAVRAILEEATGGVKHDGPTIDVIPLSTPVSETDAYKQDVEELPEVSSLDDYARVPVSQFGAALLRGMGWKEGTAASRKPGKGLVEPYLPASRPALLGIGAKEQEVYDDGSKKKAKRPDKKYVPVVRKEKEGTPAGGEKQRERDRDRGYGRERDEDARREKNRSWSPRRSRHSASRKSSRSPGKYSDSSARDRDRDRRRPEDGKERYRDRQRDRSRERRRNDY